MKTKITHHAEIAEAKPGRRKAEVRRPRTEDGGRRSEDRGQRSEGGELKMDPTSPKLRRTGAGRLGGEELSKHSTFNIQHRTSNADPGNPESDFGHRTLDFGQPASDAIAAAGEQLRAALERNNQAVTALFTRMFEQVEQQTRRLADMERRAAELAGQIKGLKNP